MKSSKKRTAKKTAHRKAEANVPLKKKVAVRGKTAKAAKAKVKTARPVAKSVKPARKAATAPKPIKRNAAPVTTAKKAPRPTALPARKEMKAMPRTPAPAQRPAAGVQPKAPLRMKAAKHDPAQPLPEHPAHTELDVQHPAATYDPTPDTNVPLRGQTSFPHNAQSERVAALKGQRARNSRRKH